MASSTTDAALKEHEAANLLPQAMEKFSFRIESTLKRHDRCNFLSVFFKVVVLLYYPISIITSCLFILL
jgi:hypothetical protein